MRGALALATAVLVAAILQGCGLAPVGGPAVPPGRSCLGLPAVMCEDEFARVLANRPGQQIVGFHMRCVAAVCDPASGEAEVHVAWDDGVTEMYGSGWAGAEPAPVPGLPAALPVVPECHGVPEHRCVELAVAAIERLDPDSILGIGVQCAREDGCDATVGEGTTIVGLADGAEVRKPWQYGDSPD